jgi:peptide/nickel transport system permease protein
MRYVLRRAVEAFVMLFGASIGIFFLIRLLPGDPAQYRAGVDATPQQLQAVRQEMGLNQPIYVQYGKWAADAVRLNFGKSLVSDIPVRELVLQRLPDTIELALAAMAIVVVLGGVLGLIAGLKAGSWIDKSIGVLNSVLLSVPSFWVSILLVLVFSLTLSWFPSGGQAPVGASLGSRLHFLALPAISLALGEVPTIARFLRSGVLDVLREDFVLLARAKGMPPRIVLFRHLLRNALLPVVTVAGLMIGSLLGGVVIVETVFSWPGLGTLVLTSIEQRDYSVVQSALLLVVVIFVVVNFFVDLVYGVIDPRVRVGRDRRAMR